MGCSLSIFLENASTYIVFRSSGVVRASLRAAVRSLSHAISTGLSQYSAFFTNAHHSTLLVSTHPVCVGAGLAVEAAVCGAVFGGLVVWGGDAVAVGWLPFGVVCRRAV